MDEFLKYLPLLALPFANGLDIKGPSSKVSALLTCATSVPDLVARIEELEGTL